MPRDGTKWENKTRALRKNFVDEHTRALAFSFNLYNGNDFDEFSEYNRLDFNRLQALSTDPSASKGYEPVTHDRIVVVQITFILHISGHIDRVARISSIRPMREYFYSTGGSIFYAWIALGALQFLMFLLKLKNPRQHFIVSVQSTWNTVDGCFYLLMLYTFFEAFGVVEESTTALKALQEAGVQDKFTDLMPLRSATRTLDTLVAGLEFSATLKFLKYMNKSERLSFLWRVIGHAQSELIPFFIVFLTVLLAFALFTVHLFGKVDLAFHDVKSASIALLQLTVGVLEFDVFKWIDAERFWAPMVLIMFIFGVMLVFVNYFIAIMSDSYRCAMHINLNA